MDIEVEGLILIAANVGVVIGSVCLQDYTKTSWWVFLTFGRRVCL